MLQRYIDTKNGKIWSLTYGEGKEGTPILVVHGGPGFSSMPEVIKDLATDRPVCFYDQLGCGRSDKAKDIGLYNVENYVDELDEVIEGLGFENVILLGMSWGCGLVCSYMLEKRSKKVKGLILSGPLLSSPKWETDQRENILALPESTRLKIEKYEISKDYGAEYQEAVGEYYRRFVCRLDPWPEHLQMVMGAMNMDIYLEMWGPSEFTVTGNLKDFDLSQRLSEIHVPVILICGDNDEALVKTVKDFQTAFRHAHMAVIPNSAHMHHIEQPEIYKAVIRGFLKDTNL